MSARVKEIRSPVSVFTYKGLTVGVRLIDICLATKFEITEEHESNPYPSTVREVRVRESAGSVVGGENSPEIAIVTEPDRNEEAAPEAKEKEIVIVCVVVSPVHVTLSRSVPPAPSSITEQETDWIGRRWLVETSLTHCKFAGNLTLRVPLDGMLFVMPIVISMGDVVFT